MPTCYECKKCKISFHLGGFFAGTVDFSRGDYLACFLCATPYLFLIPNLSRGPKYYEDKRLVIETINNDSKIDALRYLIKKLNFDFHKAKLILEELPYEIGKVESFSTNVIFEMSIVGIVAKFVIVAKEKNPNFGKPLATYTLLSPLKPICKDSRNTENWTELKLGLPIDNQGELLSANLKCAYCKRTGKIFNAIPKDNIICPSCGEKTLFENGGFVT